MNLKDQLSAKQAQLVELKSAIEAGDAEAIEKADAITTECADLEARIAKAAKASEMLAKLGNTEPKSTKSETAVKSIGEFAAKSLDIASIKGRVNASVVTPEFKAALPHMSLPEITYDRNIAAPFSETPLRDAFGSVQIDGNAYSWVVMYPSDNDPLEPIGEGELKTPLVYGYARATRPLEKLAGYYKDTDELLEDNGYLANAIDQYAVADLRTNTETYVAGSLANAIINGVAVDGGGTAYATAPVTVQQAQIESMTAPVFADHVYNAIMKVKAVTGVNPDTVVIPSELAMLLRTGRDGAGQYYGGGYFYGPYGNGTGFELMPNLWGVRVIVSDAISNVSAQNGYPLAIVGNFKRGAAVVTKRAGIRVDATNSNENDFIYNLVTVRVEERLLFAMRNPSMFSAVIAVEG